MNLLFNFALHAVEVCLNNWGLSISCVGGGQAVSVK